MRPDIGPQIRRMWELRNEWLAIHDDSFAAGWWTSLRRVVPIPGFFEAVPHGEHAAALERVIMELGSIYDSMGSIVGSEYADKDAKNLAAASLTYLQYLAPVLHIIYRIKVSMASGIERGSMDYTPAQYKADIAEYEQARERLRTAAELIVEVVSDLKLSLAE